MLRRLLEVAPGCFWIVDMGDWEPRRGRLLETTLGRPGERPQVRTLAEKLDRAAWAGARPGRPGHGFAFEVLARLHSPEQFQALALDAAGRTAADLAPRDTVLVWPGETLRLRVPFTPPFAGAQRYMFHCHNLEHEDGGMMLPFTVAGT